MEDNQEMIKFLFDISKEVKDFYEAAVIFVTKKDYSDIVFNTSCVVRKALQDGIKANQDTLIDSIVDYHLAWLHAVNDIESFKKRVGHDLHRDEIFQAISFTIDAMNNRLKYYQRYMEKNRASPNLDQNDITAEIEIVQEMHKAVTNVLLEKLKCFKNPNTDENEFKLKTITAADELLSWLDTINDGLSMQLSKYINLNVPRLTGDLTKTLQQIVEESYESPGAQKMLADLSQRGREISTMIRCTADRSLEISKVVEKINVLGDRISRLESNPSEQPSAAIMGLKRKKEFLEKRLESLENLKTTLKVLGKDGEFNFDNMAEEDLCVCEDFFQLRIFNHVLPAVERERLVTELCYLWDLAVFGERSHKSIISILSAADMKEEFTDELGSFYIDEYSRKIYKVAGDDILYQPNEVNELVPLSDDKDHVYFYDECGRYFSDSKSRQRIYKAHAKASEYMMDTSEVLIKIKEEREGITYYYDNYGRYFISDEGKHIYREEDAVSEYENDGLGNLVRIRSRGDLLELCPGDVNVTEDFKYLKIAVGPALRQCIADCIIHQPPDPIKYLSCSLIKYRKEQEIKDKRKKDKEELEVERELIRAQAEAERAALEAALLDEIREEASYDSNLHNYSHDADILPVQNNASICPQFTSKLSERSN